MTARLAGLLTGLVMALVTIVAAPTAVGAGVATPGHVGYPIGSGVIVVTDRQVYEPGSVVTITARACPAGGVVTFTITPPGGGAPIVLTATAVAGGSATGVESTPTTVATVQYTPTAVGTYLVVVSCGEQASNTTFVVSDAALPQPTTIPVTPTTAPTGRPGIPSTGSDVSGLAIGAAIVLAVGIGMFVIARSRRRPGS